MSALPIDTSPAAAQGAFFSVRDIHAYYGESYIVQGVSLEITHGEILALLGRNGAGKTSTLRAIARLDDPALHRGEIWLDGQAIHPMKSYQAARAGIQLVPEDRRIIQGLTVEENLALAQVAPGTGWDLDRIYGHFPRLAERRKQEGTTLSGGEQQMLAIGRALMGAPRFLMLDEPSLGIAPLLVKSIFERIREINQARGITILLVEQNANLALEIASYGYVLESGKVILQDDSATLRADPRVRSAYLGG